MKSRSVWTVAVLVSAFAAAFTPGSAPVRASAVAVGAGRVPRISPDYVGIVIPPNVAPLDFTIQEPGEAYRVRISSASGRPLELHSKTSGIVIPQQGWRDLLAANAGHELHLDVQVKAPDGTWTPYQTIVNPIAAEKIDPFLVYRFMMPSSYFPKRMVICQRNLEGFDEKVVLDTQSFGKGCAHCHAFVGNAPDKALLGIRSMGLPSSTLFVHDGKVDRIGAKFGYTAWHPSGRIAALSINDVRQFFHTASTEIHDVVDLDSTIAYYDVETGQLRTSAGLSDKQRLETYPAWAPDGRTLYFCSAPLLWKDRDTVPPKEYRQVRYDLMRIPYDVNTDTWGSPQTLLSAQDTGRSCLLPRVSPDGRFLLFCMCEYGCFPIYQPTSDLYVMDLQSGRVEKAPINSEHAEAWHSWSSNSRWIVFSSKRQAGVFTRPYLSYISEAGLAHKPFILPQKDPSFYESCCGVYSMPELVSGPLTVPQKSLVKALLGPALPSVDTVTSATPKAGESQAYTQGGSVVQ